MNVHYDLNVNDRARKVLLKSHQRPKLHENDNFTNVFEIFELYKWNFIHKIILWKKIHLLYYRFHCIRH